jgi:hypothetical protein
LYSHNKTGIISISNPFLIYTYVSLFKIELSHTETRSPDNTLVNLLEDANFIYRIGKRNNTVSEKLQLLILKLLIILWEHDDNEDIMAKESTLQIIDDVRHELMFLRARYYKEILNLKMGVLF